MTSRRLGAVLPPLFASHSLRVLPRYAENQKKNHSSFAGNFDGNHYPGLFDEEDTTKEHAVAQKNC